MVGYLDSVAGVAGDIHGVELAMAGLADVNARASVAADCSSSAPNDSAGMSGQQAKGLTERWVSSVIENTIAAAGIQLRRVFHHHAVQPIVLDDVVGECDPAVTAVELQMAGHHDDSASGVVDHTDATVQAEGSAIG